MPGCVVGMGGRLNQMPGREDGLGLAQQEDWGKGAGSRQE